MEHTSCTEDRIHHALDRCLYGLGHSSPNTQPWNAGLCINRWSLEELVKRDPQNFIILLQQILRKTREVLEQSQDELVVPLALLFSSTLLQTPHFSPDSGVLQDAFEVFHCFLSWPEPCCSASRHLLSLIQQELRAPGISFQRLLREEQGLTTTTTTTNHSKTMTVLLMSPGEDVPPELLSVSEQLSGVCHSQRDTSITLIKHAFQAALGTKYPLQILHHALQSKGAEDLEQLVTAVTEALETAASTQDPDAARESLLQSLKRLVESIGIPPPDCYTSPGNVHTLTLPLAKCHMYSWDKDNFDILNDLLQSELDQLPVFNLPTDKGEEDDEDEETEEETIKNRYTDHQISTVSICSKDSMFSSYSLSSSLSVPSTLSESSGVDSDFSEDLETDDGQPETRRRPKSKVHLSQRFSMLFKSQRSSSLCRRAQSMGSRGDVIRDGPSGALFKRSKSLPRQVRLPCLPRSLGVPAPTSDGPFPQSHHVCVRKRPILSCEEGDGVEMSTLVRVVVFGGDREAGRLARAYTDLQQRESRCPRLTRAYRLQFYFVPVKRGNLGGPGVSIVPEGHLGSLLKCPTSTKSNAVILEDSTTDIAQLIGMTDPWYKQSVLSLLSLSSDVLCQTTSKVDCDSDSSSSERVLLLADLVLYYCRNAAQPVLLQLYQAELTLAGGEKRREVFIHSLELGHTAGTRAVKAMGAASKRFGIDGDREALPLALYIVYNKVFVSGRSQRTETDMVCTSINLRKACKRPQQLDSKMESLHLTMTEVLKIQSSKSKKNYNQQISRSEVKVDKVQVSGGSGITFPVCLDQDEKKIIQSVIRCEVSLCCKPGSGSDWRSHRSQPGQVQPLHPSFCSLLCLPITSFCGSQPS